MTIEGSGATSARTDARLGVATQLTTHSAIVNRTLQFAPPNGRDSMVQPQWSIVLSWRGPLSLLERRLAALNAATWDRAQLIVVRTSSIPADRLQALGL